MQISGLNHLPNNNFFFQSILKMLEMRALLMLMLLGTAARIVGTDLVTQEQRSGVVNTKVGQTETCTGLDNWFGQNFFRAQNLSFGVALGNLS